ncbi:MAG: hypothetical protein KBI46_08280 [Phycisphaerae bacterium]|nr:hypothetical protein [Phycisphaerae bacterium]
MKSIAWDNSFETGNTVIDQHNKAYLCRLNRLIKAIEAHPRQAAALLGDFPPYARRHFRAQESSLARTVDVAVFEDHQQRHRFFEDFLSRPLLDADGGAEEICAFMADRTAFHIQHLDKDALSGLSAGSEAAGSRV